MNRNLWFEVVDPKTAYFKRSMEAVLNGSYSTFEVIHSDLERINGILSQDKGTISEYINQNYDKIQYFNMAILVGIVCK